MTTEVTATQGSGNTKPSPNVKARSFQLTLNEVDLYEDLIREFKQLKTCDYGISCYEEAPTTGHEHCHIYVHFKSPYKLSKKILSYHAHVEICRGSPKQNIDYIEKNGEILDEWGERPHQGITSVGELREIKDPNDLDWKMYNTWTKIQNAPQKIKRGQWKKDVKVFYICGPSGIGKSDKIEELLDEQNIDEFEEVKHAGEFWLGIVDGKGACVYDDWRDSHMTASEFINFIDYRIHSLNIKGGSVKNNYDYIFISTVQRPENIYRNLTGEPREQWMRRMEIVNLYKDDEEEMI